MKFEIVLLCILPLISGMSVDTTTSQCYVSYLKTKGFLGAKKNEQLPLAVTPECLTVVGEAQAVKVEKLRKKFLADEDTAPQTECIISKLKKTDIFDRELIEHLDVTKAKVDRETVELSEGLGLLTNVINIIKALVSCEVETVFDDEFAGHVREMYDELFDEEPDQKADDVDYCVRKHLVDSHLISFNSDKFDVNPKHIDTSAIDCNVLYQDYAKSFEHTLIEAFEDDDEEDTEDEKKWEGCFTRIMRQNSYVDHLMQFDYITEYHLTPEQKETLRTTFVEAFTNVAKTAVKCHVPDGLAGL